MKKRIILGIGILIILLALAGTGSARFAYASDCSYCHIDFPRPLTDKGVFFNDTHKFNGLERPASGVSCSQCHVDPGNPVAGDFSLTAKGTSYNLSHRYNSTTLASKMLSSGCVSCHVDAVGGNFALLTGTPTYLNSTTCQACHKTKYDNWSNTLHAVMLTPADKAQAMNLPTPPGYNWSDLSYVIVSKFELAYINTTGYFLANNDVYETETQTFADSSHTGGKYSCAKCHTTGYNAAGVNSLPGITGTFNEPGIACERCHGAGGNGHQVAVNYSGDQCQECHAKGTGSHGTGWELGEHAPPPYEIGSNCMFCHSSFDQYKNQNVTEEAATGVSCGVCHNIHDMTDAKYAATFTGGTFNATAWSEPADSKLAFFNATASRAAGTDIFDDLSSINLLYPGIDSSRKDASYGTAPINVTGKPDSVKLCSICHYRHGIAHMSGINLSHANGEATCIDCHMEGANAKVGRGMMKNHDNKIDSGKSCGGAKCHGTSVTSDPMVANGSQSMQKRFDEWGASLHNDKAVGGFAGPFNNITGIGKSKPNSCNVCKSPVNWNPATDYNTTDVPNMANVPITMENFEGITCSICHPLHDMGNWFEETFAIYGQEKAIGLYEKVKVGTRYKGTYKLVKDSTELCGSCHSNDHPRLKAVGNYAEPGWPLNASNPNSPHGFPAAELFRGSWKQTSLLEFECTSCHYSTLTSVNGTSLPQDQRIRGHSFKVNVTLLQDDKGTQNCSSCHVTGSKLGNISTTIEDVQVPVHAKYNATNVIVTAALNNVKAFTGENSSSRQKIAQAYWNTRLVNSDQSWGVHNPTMANQLLDDAARLANESVASLGPFITSVTITPTSPSAGDEINLTIAINNPGASFNGRVEGNVWAPDGTGKYLGWENVVIPSGASTVTITGAAGGDKSSYIAHVAGNYSYDVFLENVDSGQDYRNATHSKLNVAFRVAAADTVYISNVVLSNAPTNGNAMTLSVTISNPTASAFTGTMNSNIWDSASGHVLTPQSISIAAGGSQILTFSYTPVRTGLHSYDFFMVSAVAGQNDKSPWSFSCMDYVAGIGFTVV